MTREEALAILDTIPTISEQVDALEMAIEALQERKTGKWIDNSEDGYVGCPICGHLTTCEGNIEDLHYCFWCGAKMTKEGGE